jgi:CTP:molybdopterin cytidylyltransferase MocA
VTTAAIVLAAGGGTRFGPSHKLLADFRGRPLVAWALEAASSLDELIVVTGAVDLGGLLPAGARAVRNERWAEGQATSLAAGVAAAAGHVATYGGARRNPVRLAAEVWPLLPTEGDEGARSLLRRRPELVTEVACAGEPADVDTQEDLATWS